MIDVCFRNKQMAETFVTDYYLTLRHSPQQINDFYKDISELVRPVEYGSMTVTNTLDVCSLLIFVNHNLI